MTLLLTLNVATPEREVLIGDLVHLSDTARPATKRCTPALVTRVLSGDTMPRLNLHEMIDQTGNAKARYPTGGYRHMNDAPDAPVSWHMRAECPDSR
jgi:hypothetical protein